MISSHQDSTIRLSKHCDQCGSRPFRSLGNKFLGNDPVDQKMKANFETCLRSDSNCLKSTLCRTTSICKNFLILAIHVERAIDQRYSSAVTGVTLGIGAARESFHTVRKLHAAGK